MIYDKHVRSSVRSSGRKIRLISRTTLFGLLLVTLMSTNAFSWSGVGHPVVAYIAYKGLTPQTRNRVDQLIALNPKISQWRKQIPASTSPADTRMMLFIIAATWADQIKNDGEHEEDGTNGGNTPPTDGTAARNIGYSDTSMHKYWHFIDMPFSTDNTPLINPDTPNALTQISAFRATLASNADDNLKSYDLVWLLHIVGDVHQPLHCTSRFSHALPKGDIGGNSVKLCNQTCVDDKLHSFWDGIFGNSSSPKRAVTVGKGLFHAPVELANDLNASNWITDGFNLAKEVVYQDPPIGNGKGPFTVTAEYRKAAISTANSQVALAGARMANILNNELR